MRTLKLNFIAICCALSSATVFVSCTEEAPRRPQTNEDLNSPPDTGGKKNAAFEPDDNSNDPSSEDADLLEHETNHLNSGLNSTQNGSQQTVETATADKFDKNNVPTNTTNPSNPSGGGSTSPDLTAAGQAAAAAASSVLANSGTIKTTQSTLISSVTDASIFCSVSANKVMTVTDIIRRNGSITFKLLSSVENCEKLKDKSVMGLEAHFQ